MSLLYVESRQGHNQRGALVGWADTPLPDPYKPNCFGDCYLAHAFRLQEGVRTDLGVLVEGFNSAADGGINDGGLIAGTAQNGQIDPLIPGFPELRSVLWEHGVIQDLGTLPGGYESYSSGINNRGEVSGVASNATPDANSMSFPGYQARAFLWDRHQGMQDLGTLSGGTDAIAAMINEPGHVVGWSYTSSAPNANCTPQFALATGSFIWDKKTGMTDLGSFGGTCTLAADLNDKDQVVGFSNLTGDQVNHAFAWDRATGLTDLGTVGGSFSSAWAINEHGEVVGGATKQGDLQSDAVLWRKSGGKWKKTDLGTINGSNCGFSFSINASAQVVGISGKDCTLPFLWEDGGPMVDLNTVISSNSGIHVFGTSTINDHGEIAASGVDSKGNMHAVLLIPCDENHRGDENNHGDEGCDYDTVDEQTAAQVRPAQITESSAPARGAKFAPIELMTRSRAMARRNQKFGTLQK
jgi:probable HAF family extracellular repeat protein